jgi:hypothetical protein
VRAQRLWIRPLKVATGWNAGDHDIRSDVSDFARQPYSAGMRCPLSTRRYVASAKTYLPLATRTNSGDKPTE